MMKLPLSGQSARPVPGFHGQTSFGIKRLTNWYSLSFGVMKPNRVFGLTPGVVKKTQLWGDCGKSPTVA
jgi:hypothetical protein